MRHLGLLAAGSRGSPGLGAIRLVRGAGVRLLWAGLLRLGHQPRPDRLVLLCLYLRRLRRYCSANLLASGPVVLLICGFASLLSRRKHGKRGDADAQNRRARHARSHELVAQELQQDTGGVSRAGPLGKRRASLESARHAPMRFGAKASQQEERDAACDLHGKRAFRSGNRDQGCNSSDGFDRPKRASSPCHLRNQPVSQKADDACAKDHRLGAHNPFGADKQADPAIEEKLASQECEREQRQRGKRLEGLSIDREHGAPCSADDWVCNRFYQCSCGAQVKSYKRPAFAARGQGGGPVCVEAVG